MTLHLLSFKNPETKFIEQQLDAFEKLNELKHNQIEEQLQSLQYEDNHNKRILDHLNEKLHAQNTQIPDKLKLNEIQFTSEEYGDVVFNSKFLIQIQHTIKEIDQIKEDYKNSLIK